MTGDEYTLPYASNPFGRCDAEGIPHRKANVVTTRVDEFPGQSLPVASTPRTPHDGRRLALKALALAAVTLAAAAIAGTRLAGNPRQAAAVVFGVLVAAMLALAAVLVPWRRLPAPRADQVAALADLPADQVARGKRLHAELRPWAYAGKAVSLAATLGLGLTPAGSALVGWAGRLAGRSWVAQVLLGALAVTLIMQVLTIPFAARTHAILVRYGLSTQTWRAWLVDGLKALAVGGVILGIMLLGFYGAGHYFPRWWWVWAASFLIVVSVLLTFIFPVMIAPIFNKFTPLQDGPLRDRLLALAARDGVKVRDVFVADASRRTRAVNAAVGGLGATRRIILFDNLLKPPANEAERDGVVNDGDAAKAMSDTLLRGATDDQIAVIVAHELAHAKYHDLLTRSVFGAFRLAAVMCGLYLLGGWAGLLHMAGVDSFTEPRALGLFLVAMSCIGALLGPVNNLISRSVEARADRHALDLTGDPAAFEGVWRHVVEVNLAEAKPGRIRHVLSADHPSIVERIATARAYARQVRAPELVG